MNHHNHSLINIHHHKGQMVRTIVLIIVLVMTVLRWSVFGIMWSWVRLVLWMIVLLLLPWRWITKVLWKHNEIESTERIIVSFAFSLSVVPLLVFYANIIWIPVSEWLVIWVIVGIIGVCWLLLYKKKEE